MVAQKQETESKTDKNSRAAHRKRGTAPKKKQRRATAAQSGRHKKVQEIVYKGQQCPVLSTSKGIKGTRNSGR